MSVSSLSSLNKQILRMSGLSSGLDTDSIVTSLLKTDQLRIDKQFQQKTKLEWKNDAYRDMNLLLKNFRSDNMSVLKSSANMLSTAAYNAFKVNMIDTTNAVTISANDEAASGSMKIDSITQLASAATMSSAAISTGTVSLESALKNLPLKNALQFEGGEISFAINGETFTFIEDTTLSEMLSSVNSNEKAGVTMKYSALTDGFTITSKKTGVSSEVKVENTKGNAFASENSAFGIAQGTQNGKNAELSINNIAVSKESNTFSIDGITYTLKSKSASSISFSVDRDLDSTVDKIKNFVDSYNTMIETMQKKIDEEVYKSYPPLTDEQRESLSESQATKWDNLAKSGILSKDPNVSDLLNKMRSAFYTNVADTGKSLADIGLRTGGYAEKGKIVLDEKDLRAAVEANPDEVMKLFTNVSTAADATEKFKESGLINRLSDAMSSYTKMTTTVSITNIQDQIDDAEEKLKSLTRIMEDNEEKYYARFTAMETALSKMNSQSSWLTSQTSAWSNS